MDNDYEFDVFISYKNHDLTIGWIIEFERQMNYWLTQELGGKKPKIFFDKGSIDTGDKWPERLKEGILQSKILVCIWTPEYFQSSWCLSEWLSFVERERLLKGQMHSLICPVRFHDGEHYPQDAKDSQSLDVRAYNITNPTFWRTERAIDLEFKIQDFCKDLAKLINHVPPFQDNFPVIEKHVQVVETQVPHLKL